MVRNALAGLAPSICAASPSAGSIVSQARQEQDGHEGRGLPHVGGDDRYPGRERVHEPVESGADQPERLKRRRQDAGPGFEHEPPQQRRHHRRNRPGQQRGDSDERPAAHDGMHHHRERKTKHQLERYADQRKRHRMKQGRAETRIASRLHEVPGTDERRAQPGQA